MLASFQKVPSPLLYLHLLPLLQNSRERARAFDLSHSTISSVTGDEPAASRRLQSCCLFATTSVWSSIPTAIQPSATFHQLQRWSSGMLSGVVSPTFSIRLPNDFTCRSAVILTLTLVPAILAFAVSGGVYNIDYIRKRKISPLSIASVKRSKL
ncbi:hypothetical protein I316_00781 [Kwoniella heveanensis BCC8398]|uniref:Uncharacterized protein n=1 Tax=Kwoniella heveanensis BCC8398 TaxID=1296120 RepID=A0A1B9H304_9TREE|nr:hypothetical protein I316_00781 [Kwoniella heveanensis BCC8398]